MGVCSHSSPEFFSSFIIFSSDRSIFGTETFLKAHGIGYKRLVGKYDGVVEDSFIVNSDHAKQIRELVYNQESILLLSPMWDNEKRRRLPHRLAFLLYSTGESKSLGHFRDVSEEYAMKQGAWTYDPTDNTYWVAG